MAVPKKRKYKAWKKHKLNIKFTILNSLKQTQFNKNINYGPDLIKLFIY